MQKISSIILTIGIPGAGKTFWVKQYRETHPFTHIISTDEIRKEITGEEQCINPLQNDEIHCIARRRVKSLIDNPQNYNYGGLEILVDATNCNKYEWQEYKKLGSTLLIAKVFNISIENAKKNQYSRSRKVDDKIIEEKWKELQQNLPFLKNYFNLIDNIYFQDSLSE